MAYVKEFKLHRNCENFYIGQNGVHQFRQRIDHFLVNRDINWYFAARAAAWSGSSIARIWDIAAMRAVAPGKPAGVWGCVLDTMGIR